MIVISPNEKDFATRLKSMEGWARTAGMGKSQKLHYKMANRLEFICKHVDMGFIAKPVYFFAEDEKPEEKFCQRCVESLPGYKIDGNVSRDYDAKPKSYDRIVHATEPTPWRLKETHWIEARCSHMDGRKRCTVRGVYPTYDPTQNRPHYCLKHNTRIATA